MISPEKLASLPVKTRNRKIALLLQGSEEKIKAEGSCDRIYLNKIVNLLAEKDLPSGAGEKARAALGSGEDPNLEKILWLCNRTRHAILGHYNIPQADWDFTARDAILSERTRTGKREVYLDEIRSPYNVGSIFRTAESFGFSGIYLAPGTASPEHPRALRTSMSCTEIIPWEYAEIGGIPEELPVFALETGGTPLAEFSFPERGIVIVGNEELGVSPEGRERALSSLGLVTIPQNGRKGSLNLSTAFGILAYSWFEFFNR